MAFRALYQGKRACCGHDSASHQFSFVGPISHSPAAQEAFSLVPPGAQPKRVAAPRIQSAANSEDERPVIDAG